MTSFLLCVVDAGVDKARAILDLPEMDIEGKEITPKNYDVDINHVDFYYDKDSVGKKSKIIDDVSIHIPERTTVWSECKILFTDDLNSTSSKMKKANKLGIKIKTYE